MRAHLVGREEELRLARSALEDHGVVVLSGPAGVGKTALCDVLAQDWIRRGGKVRELRGTQGLKRIPFGALILALGVDTGDSESETLSRVTSMLGQEGPRTLVFVDDAHLLDDRSAAVVSGLAQSSNVALALAITSGETVSVDITSVWARWPQARLELQPLSIERVEELLTAILDQPMSDEDIAEIAAISLGYPLYLTAIAAELEAHDHDLKAVLELGTKSERLTSLMERRLARLDRDERRLFDCVAFAESSAVPVVLAGEDPALLERLMETGLIRQAGNRVEVAHPLLGSVTRRTLTHEGRRSCARRLLSGLEGAEPAEVAAVVRESLAVGVIAPPDHLVTAAEVALAWGDFDGVARLTSLLPDDPRSVVLRAQAARFLGETPTTEIPVGLDEDALTEYLSGTSQGLAYVERRFTDAINFLEEGIAMLSSNEHRNRLALELMVLSGLVGDLDALLGAARAVSPAADPSTRLLALSATQLAEALTLSTGASEETYRRGLEVAGEAGADAFLVEQLEMSRVMVDLAEGRFTDASHRWQAFADKTLLGSWLTIDAVIADAWLPLTKASELADSAVASLEQFDPLANLAQARIVADLRRAQLGEIRGTGEAQSPLEPGVAEIDRIMRQRVDAWMAWSQQDPTAGKRLVEVGHDAISMGHRFWGLCAFVDAIRLGHGEDVVSDIEHLVITRGAGLAVLAGHYARARSSDELWASARDWWGAGAPVYAIEAAILAAGQERRLDRLGVHLMYRSGATPVVGDLSDIPNPVSERQLEIAWRVLEGKSNERIADELFLSRRTVENHLHRLYGTLEISDGREGLVERYGWICAGSRTQESDATPDASAQ